MPAIGFGTFGSDQASAEQVAKAVCGDEGIVTDNLEA
jgi:hypothetical protein